jgi:hypothetical protein
VHKIASAGHDMDQQLPSFGAVGLRISHRWFANALATGELPAVAQIGSQDV